MGLEASVFYPFFRRVFFNPVPHEIKGALGFRAVRFFFWFFLAAT